MPSCWSSWKEATFPIIIYFKYFDKSKKAKLVLNYKIDINSNLETNSLA